MDEPCMSLAKNACIYMTCQSIYTCMHACVRPRTHARAFDPSAPCMPVQLLVVSWARRVGAGYLAVRAPGASARVVGVVGARRRPGWWVGRRHHRRLIRLRGRSRHHRRRRGSQRTRPPGADDGWHGRRNHDDEHEDGRRNRRRASRPPQHLGHDTSCLFESCSEITRKGDMDAAKWILLGEAISKLGQRTSQEIKGDAGGGVCVGV